MIDILIYLMIGFMAILGIVSSVYLVVSIPVVLIYKIHRKIRFNERIM